MNTISEKIVGLRREKGLTQEELARMIGVSAQTVSKWENSTTMPDILLLTLIADVFEITVDELFGRSPKTEPTYPYEDAADECYDAIHLAMRKAWIHGSEPKESPGEWLADVKQTLAESPDWKSQIRTHRNGDVWIDANLGLVFKKEPSNYPALLADEEAAGFLRALENGSLRRVLTFLMQAGGKAFTAGALAVKCGIAEEEAAGSLEQLKTYKLVAEDVLDTGEETVRIFKLQCAHRLPLLAVILYLAKSLATYQDCYRGFRG